ncbi:chemotaxis protein CheW [Thiovibrio frasassiensis]|jgi:chemotaxis signal transduction protein|uniref:Chemotaxis protein CheW n=1 Tax=Thiovibrio frasassiensis TaxID=2984131 RepID=A0A9X4MDL2_9BACT|nr:chemotaxis protein CheW [Thiovibrio frasassiensis]MDG4474612.1 chemotaxis protein CheW [Thiovibrio frasassiensis]
MGISAMKSTLATLIPDPGVYGHDSLRITEILGMMTATALPIADATVMGIINFRGRTVPVIDLRVNPLRGLNGFAEQICILSAESMHQTQPLIFGALVDSEADAYDLIVGSTH